MSKTNDVEGLFRQIGNKLDLEFAQTAWMELARKFGRDNVEAGAIKKRCKQRQCDSFKREGRYQPDSQPALDALESRENVEEAVLRRERSEVLYSEIERLPPNQAMAIRRCCLQGDSLEQVANETGKPIGTIKAWLHRGRTRLGRSSRLSSVVM